MCGISVWHSGNKEIDKERFIRMNQIIEHRGPDDEGYFYDSHIALGHRRLSILDTSQKGHQPFIYKSRYVMVFNGEIYNYIELRKELEKSGYSFQTSCDTEVLIAMYDCYGEKCLDYLNGMWAFVIYDKTSGMLFGSRDRFGIKPLYYFYTDGELAFASEIKQLLCLREEYPRANRELLECFLVNGDLDYTNGTLFEGIFQLLPGHCFRYYTDEDRLEISSYYKIAYSPKGNISYEEACRAFERDFYHSIKLRMRSDVKLGYCLSGGLDSSSIVCAAARLIKENNRTEEQHTVSSCSEDKHYDEQEYIDLVNRKTGFISHKIFPDGGTLFENLDQMIWHMDEPFGSTSVFAQWNVFQEAGRCGLKVMLDGQGADEQLAGYTPFYKVLFCHNLRKFRWIRFYKEWKAYRTMRSGTEKHVRVPSIQYLAASAFLPRNIKEWLEKKKSINTSPFSDAMVERCRKCSEGYYRIEEEGKYFEDSMYRGMQALLHYEDRNSMAFSIESRVPFLDVNLVETLAGLPLGYKIRNARTKAVLRDGLAGTLPEEIRNRYSKLGFVTPEDQWQKKYRDFYRKELELACDRLQGVLDKERVLGWFDDENNIKQGIHACWRIICVSHWINVFHVQII